MSTRVIRALILVVTLAVTAGPTACAENLEPAPQVVAASDPITVATLNVHGGTDRKGFGNRGVVGAVQRDVLQLVAEYRPTVVALQELCGRQYRALRSSLGRLGYSAAFTTTTRSKGCNDRARGNQSGNALFVLGRIVQRASWSLPWGKNPKGTTGRQPRRLLCVQVDAGYRACVTHLSPHAPDVVNQSAKVAGVIGRWSSGRLVLGGDLNLNPSWVGRLFPSWQHVGEGIDHVLGSSSVQLVGTRVVPSSDHDALIGRAS